METAGTLSKWSPSSSSLAGILSFESSSSSFSSIPSGMMDDLPFCLEDLPPEIRDKIDDIIEKNEDLESQLEAIDTLLFANRPPVKSDVNSKFDLGNESGIGSDSDSGHGVIPAQDPLSISPFPSRPHKNLLENAKTLGPLVRTSAPNDDEVDDFISRIIVPPPPYLTGATSSPVRPVPSSRELNFTPRSTPSTGFHRGIPSVAVSTAPSTRNTGGFDGDLPTHLPPPPLEFGESLENETLSSESPPTSEAVSVVRTGQNFLVTLDVPRGLLSNGSPAGDSSTSNVTRVHVGKEEKQQLPVNVTSVPVLNSVNRRTAETAEPIALRPSQLYAWNKTPEPLDSIRESPPDKSAHQKKSVTLPAGKPQRPSELSLSTTEDKQPRFWKKGSKDARASPDLSSSPSRYNQVASGPSVEMRRKKWRPASDVLPEGVRIGSLDSGGRLAVNRSTDNVRSDAEDVEEERKSIASDDDFSSIVVMRRTKNGKPAQPPKIDLRTLKAQSMLSLYDPSSDLKEGRSKDKKTKAVVKSKSKLDPFAFFRAKNRNRHNPERSSSERCVSLDASTLRESDMEPLRSDYLFLAPPPPLSTRSSSIPSPSLYPSVDPRNSCNSSIRQMRSPPPPGDVSDIYRIDVRDLDIGSSRRPPVTFHTFRSEVQPMRWSEERPRFPVSNRWSHRTFEEMESPSCNVSRSPSALASTCSLPVNLSQFVGGRPLSKSSKHQNVLQHRQGQHPVLTPCPSPPKQSHRVQETIARSDGEHARQSSSPSTILVFNGQSSPVIKVSTTEVATTKAPQLTRAVTPTEPPQVFTPSTSAASAGTRLSIASACLGNAMAERGRGRGSRQNSSVTPVYLQSLPRNQYLTPSYSNPDVVKAVSPGRLSPRQSFAGPSEEPQVPQSRISPCPSVTSLETSVSGSGEHDDVDSVNWNGLEELLVLQTTYDSDLPGDRAEDDVSRMLSSLEAQRKWLLSAGSSTSSSNPSKLFRSRKDSLATQSRRLVTEAKLMVSAATRSQQELTSTLTPVVHTVARVFESCRQVLAVLPPDDRRTMLHSQVADVGRMFLNTLTSANLAAGRRHDDPAMEQLMTRTTALAQALLKLLNTTKSLDCNVA